MRPGRRSRLLAWIRLVAGDESALREPRSVVRSSAHAGYSLCYRSLSSTAAGLQKRQNRVIGSDMEQKVLHPALIKRMPKLVQSRGFRLRES